LKGDAKGLGGGTVWIGKHGEFQQVFLLCFLGVYRGVWAGGNELKTGGLELFKCLLQLDQLLVAMGSPAATVKNNGQRLVVSQLCQRAGFAR
jgi:hypothetical protein